MTARSSRRRTFGAVEPGGNCPASDSVKNMVTISLPFPMLLQGLSKSMAAAFRQKLLLQKFS